MKWRDKMRRSIAIIFALLITLTLCIGLTACNTGINITVTFMVDGEQYSQQTTKEGVSPVMPSNPIKENYTFDAWYFDNGVWEKPMTTQSFLDLPLTENMVVTVYAHFTENNPSADPSDPSDPQDPGSDPTNPPTDPSDPSDPQDPGSDPQGLTYDESIAIYKARVFIRNSRICRDFINGYNDNFQNRRYRHTCHRNYAGA